MSSVYFVSGVIALILLKSIRFFLSDRLMALSSWLGFGKKKTSGDSDPTTDRTATHTDTEDYVVIERKPNPAGSMYPTLGVVGTALSLPYQVQPLPSLPGETVNEIHTSNPLDDVPFKLSSLLIGGSCEWTRSDAAHFKSVMSRAVHHNDTVYKYDFSHEKSIMRESNQGSIDVA